MISAPFRIEALHERHDRAGFDCGEAALDGYLRTQATQDIRRRIANCFVVADGVTGNIGAYYTLSAASIPMVDLPEDVTKRLPRYPTIPAVRIGRLAVDRRFQRRGLGELMIVEAIHRTTLDSAAAFAMLVDARNEAAARSYERYGFRSIIERPNTLFLPLATAVKALLSSRL